MKKLLCFFLCLIINLETVHGQSYCVMSDADNTVIEEKDMHKVQSVASISKVMTAILALEKGDLNLEESVSKFEEGMKLSKECSNLLEDAEKRITILIKDGDEVQEENFLQEEE